MIERVTMQRRRAAASPEPEPPLVQRSLRVGSSRDPAEVEADEMAELVVRQLAGGDGTRVQPASPRATSVADEAASRVNRSATGAIGADGGDLDGATTRRIEGARGGGRPLPSSLGQSMEQAFGADFSAVRLHTDATSDQLNRQMQAQAFTTGSDVFLSGSTPSLSSTAGTKLLAHELTHVVQQGGRIQRSARSTDVVRRVTAPANIAQATADKKQAVAAHKKDRAALLSIVRAGAKSKDRRTRNACEWILDGRTKLYALNATGDSKARAAHLNHDVNKTECWFPKGDGGAGDLQSAAVSYNALDLDDQTNIEVDTDDGPSTNGWNGNGFVAVMMGGGTMSKAEVLETLRHEVQHDADKNRVKRAAAVAVAGDVQADAVDMAKAFEGYKTEYRAYNYESRKNKSYNKLSPTKVVTKYGVKWSERQLAVFEQIHAGYEHTQKFWDDSFETAAWGPAHPGKDGPDKPSDAGSYHDANITANWKSSIEARRRALVDYINPDTEGFNKWDSIRVEDFYKALDAVPVGTSDSSTKEMSTLMWKTGFLGKDDARYVLERSVDMRKKMKAHLIDGAYVAVHQGLCTVAGVKKATPFDKLGDSDNATIQKVSVALDAVPIGTTDTKDPNLRTLRFATAKLTKKEAKRVLKHEPKLLNKIDRQLAGAAHTEYIKLLKACVG